METNFALVFSKFLVALSNFFIFFSSVAFFPEYLAEKSPGSLFSNLTSRPESSPSEGKLLSSLAFFAFNIAFSS